MYCPKCGAAQPENAQFCFACGCKLSLPTGEKKATDADCLNKDTASAEAAQNAVKVTEPEAAEQNQATEAKDEAKVSEVATEEAETVEQKTTEEDTAPIERLQTYPSDEAEIEVVLQRRDDGTVNSEEPDFTLVIPQTKKKGRVKKIILRVLCVILSLVLVIGIVGAIVVFTSPAWKIYSAAKNSLEELNELTGKAENFYAVANQILELANSNGFEMELKAEIHDDFEQVIGINYAGDMERKIIAADAFYSASNIRNVLTT